MDLNEDVAYLAIEILGKSKARLSLSEMLDEIPFERRDLVAALTVLHGIGLIERTSSESGDGFQYQLSKEASAYQITKAVELGVDVGVLSRWMKVSDKQKQAALALSMQAQKLKEMDETLKAERGKARKADPAAGPRDMVVDTLERLLQASEISIEDYSKTSKEGDEILKALQDARAEALKALDGYRKTLSSGTGGYDYF